MAKSSYAVTSGDMTFTKNQNKVINHLLRILVLPVTLRWRIRRNVVKAQG